MHAVHDVVARRRGLRSSRRRARAARRAVHAAAAGEVGFGDERELRAGQHHAAVERRDDDVRTGRRARGVGSPTRSTSTPSPASTVAQAVAPSRCPRPREHAVARRARSAREPAARARRRRRRRDRTRSRRAAACRGCRARRARAPRCAFVCASSRSNGSDRRGKSSSSTAAPHVTASVVGERGLLVEQLLGAVAQAPRLDEQRRARSSGSRSGSRCSSAVSHGSHDSMPSNVWPSASRSHCSRAPRLRLRASSAARARTSSVGQQLARREDPRLVDVVRRALVGDRELRQPVDLVAPEVDAHRVVGGRRVHVDDRAAHRDLAARLDLVLAPVAHRRRAARRARRGRSASPGRDDDRLDVLDVRARAAARARAPARRRPRAGASPPARSRQITRRRRPIVSSAGDTRSNGSVSHAGNSSTASAPRNCAQVGGEPLGLGAGRHREHDGRRRRGAGERGDEQRPGRARAPRPRRARPGRRCGDAGSSASSGGEPGEGGGSRHGVTARPGTRRAIRGVDVASLAATHRTRRAIGRCSGSSRRRRRR